MKIYNFCKAFLGLIIPIWLLQYCQPKEEITTNESVLLRFDTDTIAFDTVFTGQLSLTKRLKVYNTNDNAITISSIRLGGMANSYFSLIVNGLQTNQTNDLYLRGKDSLLILATVTLNSNNNTIPFLVSDSIIFNTNANEQRVYLTSYGQNATYYNGDTLTGNTIWDSTTAKFIKRTIYIPQGSTLTIEKGTRIHLVKGAGIKIAGTLVARGDSGQKVVFQGPRLDENFRNVSSQWKGIEFTPTSTNNSLDFVELKNAETGIIVGDTNNVLGSYLKITNTIIKNMSGFGLKASNTQLIAWNCLIYNCAYNGFLLSEQGDYKCYNNSFAFTISDFTRFGAALEVKEGSRNVELINNIIWGNGFGGNEIIFKKGANDVFKKNLVRSTDNALTSDTSNIWNEAPKFISEDRDFINFQIDSLSPARRRAIKLDLFTIDLKGKERGATWDIGAYQYYEK